MNVKDIATQLLYSTTPILGKKANGEVIAGTGFFYSYTLPQKEGSIPFLVGCRHTLGEMDEGQFKLSIRRDEIPSGEFINVHFDRDSIMDAMSADVDLAVLPIGPGLAGLDKIGKPAYLKTIDQGLVPDLETRDELSALEEITLFGYPNHSYAIKSDVPIIQRGITSTPIWNRFEGRSEFLIDTKVSGGLSGSPVFIFNRGSYPTPGGLNIGSRLLFAGMLKGSLDDESSGLGVVINSDVVRDEIELIAQTLA